jgi:hypothetical protein
MIQINLGWANKVALEPLIWITMFSMYGVVFFVFGSLSRLDMHSPEHLAAESLWAVWIAKCFAAIAVAASLRLMASHTAELGGEAAFSPAEQAMLMSYPMFSALTGLVLASMAPRYWRPLYGLAALAWVNSILLMWTVTQASTMAPALYGALATSLAFLWGLKLKQLSREQATTGPVELDPTVELPSTNA